MVPAPPPAIATLGAPDVPRVVATLADAFHDYPVMRFVLADEGAPYAERLSALIGMFVSGRALRGEPLLAIATSAIPEAVATVSFLPAGPAPAGWEEVRERTWTALGPRARARYERCVAAWATVDVPGPQVHVNMIGVRRAWHGRGLARVLLDHVHRLADARPFAAGVSLTTEDPRNIALYEHLGYRVIAHADIAPGLGTWGFFRERGDATR